MLLSLVLLRFYQPDPRDCLHTVVLRSSMKTPTGGTRKVTPKEPDVLGALFTYSVKKKMELNIATAAKNRHLSPIVNFSQCK